MTKTLINVLTLRIVAGMFIILISACSQGGTETPPDTTSPTVPSNVQATTLSPNVIVLSWSPSSDNVAVVQYEVYVGGVPVVSLPSTTTVFLYSGLTPSTQYCCTVRAIDGAGNESALSDPPACAVTHPVSDATLPTVSSTVPANGELNVAVNVIIKATFSETMDPATVLTNFGCFDTTQSPETAVPGLVTYDVSKVTASFTPSAPLTHATIFECRVLTNVTDLLGHGMAATYVWHFVTAP